MTSQMFLTNEHIIAAARTNLAQPAWDYLVGGSESETTMRRNRLGFDRWAFRPRILRDVTEIDPSTTLLGHPMRIPVMLAPIGGLQQFDPAGGAAVAKAAHEFGAIHVVSSATQPSLEETAAAAPSPKIFQLYVGGDEGWTRDILDRVKAAGYVALALTVDSPMLSRRERPMLNRWAISPVRGTDRPGAAINWRAGLTWDTLDFIRDYAGLPFLLKGVATAEDALLAVEHGVDAIWVSNHGGRQLDGQLGTMDTLPEIVEAVAGRAQIVIDGGIQRGGDVLKAVALGANAVAIGKLQGWGLAAAGKDGVVRVLEILEHEIVTAMTMLGVTCIDELNANYVRMAEPVTPPHEMSMWVNFPKLV